MFIRFIRAYIFLLPCFHSSYYRDAALNMSGLGKDPVAKSDDFLEKFQTAFDPPTPSFLEIMLHIFCNGYGCIFARMYEDQKV